MQSKRSYEAQKLLLNLIHFYKIKDCVNVVAQGLLGLEV